MSTGQTPGTRLSRTGARALLLAVTCLMIPLALKVTASLPLGRPGMHSGIEMWKCANRLIAEDLFRQLGPTLAHRK